MNRTTRIRWTLLTGATAILPAAMLVAGTAVPQRAVAYPPAVGILGTSRDCLSCHVDNGPWKDENKLILDILDKDTRKSLKQEDGSFLISAKRGEAKTVLTVIGWPQDPGVTVPQRNAWIYVDPTRIADKTSLSKFAPGWSVNLNMACRIVGDSVEEYKDANVTVLPMTLRPADDARDATIEIQVMLTAGKSVKGSATKDMTGNFFRRIVRLKLADSQAE